MTCSTSGKNNVMKISKKGKNNSEGKKREIQSAKNKNNSMQYKCYNSINVESSNNIIFNNSNKTNKSSSLNKREKNKKILEKNKYGEILENNNLNKNLKIHQNLEYIRKIKEKSTKNKNNIIIYNNIFQNKKKRNIRRYSKIEKYRIDSTKNKTIEKIIKNNSHTYNKYKNIDNSKINNDDTSNLSKRKSYVVASIMAKKKKKIEIKKNYKNINDKEEEDNKQLFMSHLIESKQIEYLKNFEKYKIDFKDKLIKYNEKKMKVLKDRNLIDKLMSSEEECEGENEEIKKIRYNRKDIENSKEKKDIIKTNNKRHKERYIIKNNQKYKEFISIEPEENKNNSNESIEPEENKNNSNDYIHLDNIFHYNNQNNTIIYNSRKPKINTLEYIYRINNNIDMNKLITSISSLDINKNTNNINLQENNNIEPESQSSVNVFCEKKTIRPKEEINDFMKNNKIKIKRKEIKLKKEKNEKLLKKFKNFVELQKNIEENKRYKLLNKSLTLRNTLSNRNKINDKESFILSALEQIHKSQNPSSLSSSLNQQELYLSIYDAQKIYCANENKPMLIKNYSMILDNPQTRKSLELNNKELFQNIKTDYINNIKNKKSNKPRKKLDKTTIKTIKSVIFKLNNFLKECTYKNNIKKDNNINKNKKSLIRDYDYYDYILKKANRFLKEKQCQNIIKTKKLKIKKPELLIIKKQVPSDDKIFKKISMNEIKKIIKKSHTNIHINKYKIDKIQNNTNTNNSKNIFIPSNKKYKKILNKKKNVIQNKVKNKEYNFTIEQLDKYKEIFNYLFIYLKLFIQKNIFNRIISYVNLKYKYISAFNQFIIFIKKRPFNYLRIIQQREYYQVILKQFYLPYLNRALNKIKSYSVSKQIFSNVDTLIKQIYFMIFFKRILFYIEIKDEYKFEKDKIIEEDKDDASYDSSSKKENKDNLIIKDNKDNNEHESSLNKLNKNYESQKENDLYENNNNSLNKEYSESYDEIQTIKNAFNAIENKFSLSSKIFVFNLFKRYYMLAKSHQKIRILNNIYLLIRKKKFNQLILIIKN